MATEVQFVLSLTAITGVAIAKVIFNLHGYGLLMLVQNAFMHLSQTVSLSGRMLTAQRMAARRVRG